MRYLGKISGKGMVLCNGERIEQAAYDFEVYLNKPMGITSSGEIRMSRTALTGVFGRKDVQILTDDGRLLDLRFSAKELLPMVDFAHVDVKGELPAGSRSWQA
jgi:hypothetical protein